MALRLHQEKGVNPRITVCKQCGKDVGVALLGSNESVYECNNCGVNHIGGRPKECPCGERYQFTKKRNIGDTEKLPVELCDSCKEEAELHNKLVEEGGIYWRCAKCRSHGVVKKESELSKKVRAELTCEPPALCEVEFDGDCPACQNKEHDK